MTSDDNKVPLLNTYSEQNKQKELMLLAEVCKNYQVDVEIVNQLIVVEKSMIGKMKRRGLLQEIDGLIVKSLESRKGDQQCY